MERSAADAFALYQTVAKQPHIAEVVFVEFWEGITADDRAWWTKKMESGETAPTQSTMNVDSGFEAVRQGKVSDLVRAAVESGLAEPTPEGLDC